MSIKIFYQVLFQIFSSFLQLIFFDVICPSINWGFTCFNPHHDFTEGNIPSGITLRPVKLVRLLMLMEEFFKFGLFQLRSLHLLVPTTKIHEWNKRHKYWVLEIELFHSMVQAMQKWMVSEQDWVNTKLLPLNCVHWHRVKMAAASCAWHRIFQCVAIFNFFHWLHILFVDCHECKASDGCFAKPLTALNIQRIFLLPPICYKDVSHDWLQRRSMSNHFDVGRDWKML